MSDRLEPIYERPGRDRPPPRVTPPRGGKPSRPKPGTSQPAWKRSANKVSAEINVTPLVDVVLVLLIIFMVVTAAVEPGISVELPKIGRPDAAVAKLDPVTVSIDKDGKLWLERRGVLATELQQALREVHAAMPGRKVVLKADRTVEYGKVRALFKEVRDLGFPGVSLQVLERSRS
jgi:biopolymer transport protein TolR